MNRRRNCSTAASLDGRAESKNPLTTTEVNIVFLFGQRGQENERQVTPTILSLRKFHQGVEYFELSRSRFESLPTTKNHQGDLGDSEYESDAKIFSRLTVKLASNQLHTSNPN